MNSVLEAINPSGHGSKRLQRPSPHFRKSWQGFAAELQGCVSGTRSLLCGGGAALRKMGRHDSSLLLINITSSLHSRYQTLSFLCGAPPATLVTATMTAAAAFLVICKAPSNPRWTGTFQKPRCDIHVRLPRACSSLSTQSKPRHAITLARLTLENRGILRITGITGN